MISPKILLSAIGYLMLSMANLVLIYGLLASPPIHLWYDVAPPAGPSSVYVPGSGFSGFWFHLGALQSIPNLDDYDFYCYSSGCLSVVMAALNISIANAYTNAYGIQQSWVAGNMSRFEIVDEFLQNVFEESDNSESCFMSSTEDDDDPYEQQQCNTTRIERFLPRLNILVTSRGNGVEVVQPNSRSELVDALKQTTWIPFVTGDGVLRPPSSSDFGSYSSPQNINIEEGEEFYLDGGFSRMLHPTCEYDLRVPNTWINMMYTLHPGMTQAQVNELWESGRNFDHPLLTSS